MSHQLTIEIGDDTYATFQRQAEAAGLSIVDWIVASLDQRNVGFEKTDSGAEAEAARQRFQNHAGAVSLGYATGTDNEGIDADLAKAYKDEY